MSYPYNSTNVKVQQIEFSIFPALHGGALHIFEFKLGNRTRDKIYYVANISNRFDLKGKF